MSAQDFRGTSTRFLRKSSIWSGIFFNEPCQVHSVILAGMCKLVELIASLNFKNGAMVPIWVSVYSIYPIHAHQFRE